MDSATIQGTEIIHDRYQLTLTIEVKYNPKKNTITSYGTPLIDFIEIISIEGDANSQMRVKYSYENNFKLSPDQWKNVVEAGGQFSAAGIKVKTNEPIVGIEKYQARLRRPPIQ